MDEAKKAWHGTETEEVLAAFNVDPERGLDAAAIARGLARYGLNELPESKPRSSLLVFLQQFQSPLIYLLFIAAAFAFALGRTGDTAVILAVVLVNALIGWFQEGRAARSMEALRKLAGLRTRVRRGAEELIIHTDQLLPGDIILLAAGDGVGADARLIKGSALEAAEAALTGESLPVRKSTAKLPVDTLLADRSNMLFSGTHITTGRGEAVVTATGGATEVGKIARLTAAAARPKTPLELSLAQFGRYLVVGAVALFVTVMVFGIMRGIPTVEIFMVAISQVVSMVPEGLPAAMTIALAVGMQRMAGHGAIIRRLAAVETLGSTSVICADKTGTLTRNEMTVTAAWLPGGRRVDVSGAGYQPHGGFHERNRELDPDSDPALIWLLQAAALCNDARLVPPDKGEQRWRILGDPTEAALLTVARKAHIDLEVLAQEWRRQAEIPFEPGVGMMATEHRHHTHGTRLIVFKGAPEAILNLCGHQLEYGETMPLDSHHRELALQAADFLAGRALRVLAFARIENETLDNGAGYGEFAGRLTLLGLLGEMDPPREEVKVAVAQCQQAGMRAVMVTGDHKTTGLTVATVLGIAREGDWAIDGRELQLMPEPELRENIDRIAVFARVQPAQKLRIVEALQACGEVVAMTGDGVNDAPALSRADVGVAMGMTGTEVAKSAAEIVITDDNFATIVDAVKEGRLVHRNLRKVILYLFATSMAEILVLLAALLLGYPLPLAAVQILWINIVTEGTVTINLIMEPPEGDEMRQKPVGINRPLLNLDMLKRVALMTPAIALATFGYFAWRITQEVPYALVQTETFTVLAVCNWFNVVNCQSATRSAFRLGILRNRWMLGGLVLSLLLQLMVIYWPAVNGLFHTVPIAAGDFAVMVMVASVVLWAEEFRKYLLNRRRRNLP